MTLKLNCYSKGKQTLKIQKILRLSMLKGMRKHVQERTKEYANIGKITMDQPSKQMPGTIAKNNGRMILKAFWRPLGLPTTIPSPECKGLQGTMISSNGPAAPASHHTSCHQPHFLHFSASLLGCSRYPGGPWCSSQLCAAKDGAVATSTQIWK